MKKILAILSFLCSVAHADFSVGVEAVRIGGEVQGSSVYETLPALTLRYFTNPKKETFLLDIETKLFGKSSYTKKQVASIADVKRKFAIYNRLLIGGNFKLGKSFVSPYIGLGFSIDSADCRVKATDGSHDSGWVKGIEKTLYVPVGFRVLSPLTESLDLEIQNELNVLLKREYELASRSISFKEGLGFRTQANFIYQDKVSFGPYLKVMELKDFYGSKEKETGFNISYRF
jgi:hypothetical protein